MNCFNESICSIIPSHIILDIMNMCTQKDAFSFSATCKKFLPSFYEISKLEITVGKGTEKLLCKMNSVEELCVTGNISLLDKPGTGCITEVNVKKIKKLSVYACDLCEGWGEYIGAMINLVSLRLYVDSPTFTLDVLIGLKHLRNLELGSLPGWYGFFEDYSFFRDSLGKITQLTSLRIAHYMCEDVDLAGISTLNLKELSFGHCPKIQGSFLTKGIEKLNFSNTGIKGEYLKKCENLRYARVNNLVSVDDLRELKKLQVVDLRKGSEMNDTELLKVFPNLTIIKPKTKTLYEKFMVMCEYVYDYVVG